MADWQPPAEAFANPKWSPPDAAFQQKPGGVEGASTVGALWKGFLHGAGNIVHGGAQIGARMGEATDTGFGPEMAPGSAQRVDQAARAREQVYQASPAVAAHPIASGIGRVGGTIASTAPLAALPGGATTFLGRMGLAAVTGALAGSTQPVTGTGSFGGQKLKQAGFGAAGGTVGGVAGEALGSALGKAIAGNSPAAVDSTLSRFRNVIKPSRIGQTSAPQLQAQDRRIVTAVDQIIQNKPNLRLTNPSGDEVTGQLPRSVRQFSEAVDQTKRNLFTQYDEMAQKAGAAGIRVDLAPVVKELQAAAAKPEVVDLHPGLVADAEKLAQNFAARGSYTAGEAQEIIQNLNKTLAGFYRNPTAETVSHASLLAPIVRTLRSSLDAAIEGAQGTGYQALKNQYGALKSIEKDVAGAVQREANKIPGGIGSIFSDLAASEEAIRGVFTLNPAALVRAGGIKAAQFAMRYINSPNRAIDRLFSKRAASLEAPASPMRQAIGGNISRFAPGAGAVVGGVGPQGGTITGVQQAP